MNSKQSMSTLEEISNSLVVAPWIQKLTLTCFHPIEIFPFRFDGYREKFLASKTKKRYLIDPFLDLVRPGAPEGPRNATEFLPARLNHRTPAQTATESSLIARVASSLKRFRNLNHVIVHHNDGREVPARYRMFELQHRESMYSNCWPEDYDQELSLPLVLSVMASAGVTPRTVQFKGTMNGAHSFRVSSLPTSDCSQIFHTVQDLTILENSTFASRPPHRGVPRMLLNTPTFPMLRTLEIVGSFFSWKS